MVSLSYDSIEAKDVHKLQDGLHGIHYKHFFVDFFRDIHQRLKNSGVPVIRIRD
jgi:hypothetical protein